MSSENTPSDLPGGTDPRTLRALAHPVRLDLLYLLEREGQLTAGRAADLLGLTPKVCSYHLNQLSSYGIVEETGTGKGRSRPWRLAINGLSYVHDPNEQATTRRSADAFAKTMLARDSQLIDSFIDGRHRLPHAWRNVSTLSSTPLRLTPGQLRELGQELTRLVDRYRTIAAEPDTDTHPAHISVYAIPTDLADLTE